MTVRQWVVEVDSEEAHALGGGGRAAGDWHGVEDHGHAESDRGAGLLHRNVERMRMLRLRRRRHVRVLRR
jgi:hypothetical protein